LKLNSSAIFFGVDAPKVAMTFSSLFAATILVFAYKSSSSIIALGVIFLAYQINLQNKLSLSNRNLEAFKANSHVGLVIAILIFIEKQSEFFN
jgi:4-hydroxybenzoate polyprenyltransferase